MNKYQCETCKKFPCRELLESSETMSDSVLSIAMKGLYMTFISKVGCVNHSEFQNERNKVLDKIIIHCRERAKECPDDETYTDSEMDILVEWIEEELRDKTGW